MAIFQYRADDTGYFAAEARRKAAEQQKAIGTAAAKAAVPTTEEPKLLRTERTPEFSSAFKGLFDPLQSAVKSQVDFTKQLQSQQAMINPRLQASMLEDVGRVTSDLGDAEQTYGRLQQQGSEAIAARQAEAKREAMGVVERQMASRSGLGMGSEMAKIIADRVAAASIPAALQQVQFSADLADRIARQRAASIGQRQGLLSQGYGFFRDQMTDALRPISGALNLLGQAGAIDRALNIYGFGGETGQLPFSLPVYAQRTSTPSVRNPQPYVPPAPVSRATGTSARSGIGYGSAVNRPRNESEEEYYDRIERERAALAAARSRAAAVSQARAAAPYARQTGEFFGPPEPPEPPFVTPGLVGYGTGNFDADLGNALSRDWRYASPDDRANMTVPNYSGGNFELGERGGEWWR